ncbi:hypothetical protein CEXT_546731 [Caerostris extrusa]|uniref:Uncharacterized protein n=1 Tax=Caerostris extrusa TaxID=172846 RepID=A0AAV4YE91_CAEEX|nr:hypothetical protein CEXT_546731 [Caerostris extrusa]
MVSKEKKTEKANGTPSRTFYALYARVNSVIGYFLEKFSARRRERIEESPRNIFAEYIAHKFFRNKV